MAALHDVFGIRIAPILSYVERLLVDEAFKEAIRSDDHIIVYGSSKQGKTSLRLKNVPEDDCIVVRCEPAMTIESVYSSIVRQAGVKIEALETRTISGEAGVSAKVGFKASVPLLLEGAGEGTGQASAGMSLTAQTEFISFNYNEAQSIAELLTALKLKKYVVLENFHYLSEDVQRALAFGLKTFHEVGIRFIILGIWQEANLLLTYNGDLQDRIREIPVEPWLPADFDAVIAKGCAALNVSIPPIVAIIFKDNAYGNVGMLQEFLRDYCKRMGVTETVAGERRILDSEPTAAETLEEKLKNQRAQLLKLLQGIASRCRVRTGEDSLLLPYYLCLVILKVTVAQLQAGLERTRLMELLREVHHRKDKDTIRPGDLTNLLRSLPRLQKGFNPIFLYYDGNSRRLRVVDTRQFFVLARANRLELVEEIEKPTQDDVDGV